MNRKKSKISWISKLEAKEKLLKKLAAWLGLQVKYGKNDSVFEFKMERKRWWLELKGNKKTRVLFPEDKADFGKYAFDSVENLLVAL